MATPTDIAMVICLFIIIFIVGTCSAYCKHQAKQEKKRRLRAEIEASVLSTIQTAARPQIGPQLYSNNHHQSYTVEMRHQEEIRAQSQELARLRLQNRQLLQQQTAQQIVVTPVFVSSNNQPSAPPVGVYLIDDKPPMYSEVVL